MKLFNSKNNAEIKEFVGDYVCLLGKVFLAGAAVVGAAKGIQDAVNADKAFTDKWVLKK